MRTLMLLALPLLLVSCDKKEESKAHGHGMPAASADKAKDPICKMDVDKATATKVTYEKSDYYFCSDNCVAKFKADWKTGKFAAVFGHTGYLINLGAAAGPNRDKSLESLVLEIEIATSLGLPFLVITTSSS